MVFNIEPGVYFDDWGGARHCDVVALTEAAYQSAVEGRIARVDEEAPEANGRVRKIYMISARGRKVLAAEAKRMKSLLDAASLRLEEGPL